MWSTIGEVYPVTIQPTAAGQVIVVEPKTSQGENDLRFSVHKITGALAYENRGPISTLLWVTR